jgi:beta-galactosidase beta subunit
VPYHRLRFKVNERDLKLDSQVRQSCIVKVYSIEDSMLLGGNALKDSLMKLKNSKKYTDIEIILQEHEVIKAHKCLLASRSQKFKMMFDSEMNENQTNKIVINQGNYVLLKSMIDWIYTGEILFPD